MDQFHAKSEELYLRCRNCRRRTSGIEDFKSEKNGRLLLTCVLCRRDGRKGNRKRGPPSLKSIVSTLFSLIDVESLKDLNAEQQKIVNYAENKYVTKKKHCIACNGTGISYLCDGVSGDCMQC